MRADGAATDVAEVGDAAGTAAGAPLAAPARPARRIRYLDGQRGLAILLVVPAHYLGRTNAPYLPYGDKYADLPLLDRGFIGVELFFLISGFVIFMTLERCSGTVDFLVRRWLRLFPALFMASLLVFGLSQVIGSYMPDGTLNARDLLPGLTYLSPAFYHAAFNIPFAYIDGVYWTLATEFTFYLIAGLLYFRVGWAKAIAGIGLIWIGLKIAVPLVEILPKTPLSRAFEPLQWQGVEHFGWFVSGALFFKAKELGSERLFWLALAVGLLAGVLFTAPVELDPMMRPLMYMCVIFFACAQRFSFLQAALEWRPLLFVGFVSYPLYLLHCSLGIGLIAMLAPAVSPSLWLGLPLAATAFMLVLSWLFASKLEPAAHDIFASILRRVGLLKPRAR